MEALPAVPESKSLFAITDDLQTYFDTLEMVEAQLAEPLEHGDREALEKSRGELNAALATIGGELVKKTDSIAGVLRRISTETDFLKAEQDRIHARRKTFERAEKWLRNYVLSIMRQREITQLKTPSNTLFIRKSDAAVVTDIEALPAEYQNAEVKVPLALWHAMVGLALSFGPDEVRRDVDTVRVKTEPSLSTIKKAVKAGFSVPGADVEFHESLVLR